MSAPPSYEYGATRQPRTALTKTDLAYWQVRQEILEGTLAPGSALDQEALAARLGLSTTPVREALRRLESEHLVRSRAHRDTVVAELSPTFLTDTYAVRLALDPLAVMMTAKSASDTELKAIKDFADRRVGDHPVDQLQYNRELHRSIYSACGNEVLVELLDLLWDRSDRYRMITIREETEVARPHDEHVEIVNAVLSRDARRAAKLMENHIRESLKRIKESPQLRRT